MIFLQGLVPKEFGLLDTAKSCNRILTDSGYLIVKSSSGPNGDFS